MLIKCAKWIVLLYSDNDNSSYYIVFGRILCFITYKQIMLLIKNERTISCSVYVSVSPLNRDFPLIDFSLFLCSLPLTFSHHRHFASHGLYL
jgi:hypothetical protein